MEVGHRSHRNGQKRKAYAELSPEGREELLQRRREEAALKRSAKSPQGQRLVDIGVPSSPSDRNSKRRKTYAEMPIDQKKKFLKRKREQAAIRRSSQIGNQQRMAVNAGDGSSDAQGLTSSCSDDNLLIIQSFGLSLQQIQNLRARCRGSKKKSKTSIDGRFSIDAFLQAGSSSSHSHMPIMSSTILDNTRDGQRSHTSAGLPKKRKYKNIALGNFIPTSAQTLPVVANCSHCKAKRFKESQIFSAVLEAKFSCHLWRCLGH